MWQLHPVEGKPVRLELKQKNHLWNLTSRMLPCYTEPAPATPIAPNHTTPKIGVKQCMHVLCDF